MSLTVQYTDTFEYTLKVLVDFLDEHWGSKVSNRFLLEAEDVIKSIAAFPTMYKVSSFDASVRVAPIKKLSSLFYAVSDSNITLLYIVDSRQEPFWINHHSHT
ncbi:MULTISPECIES: type II toxin-antitoxin system RelE/ParE family toxin [Sphingobacterium]|uniref:type II toxin-antitoxin system RelE/ParE family toxin n=1 Tax=Sphingobacterium TaxID=28453 RepID=UPI0013D9168C|nr:MULTISPECIES: hypothetical protein [unclassified Sphingobacterium]